LLWRAFTFGTLNGIENLGSREEQNGNIKNHREDQKNRTVDPD
jgi:hypothetical protein